MDLTFYWAIARRRWVTITAVALLCVAAAGLVVVTTPTTYESSSRLYVSMGRGTSVIDSYQGGLASQQRVASYVKLVNGPAIAQRVIDDRGLSMSVGELQRKIQATYPPATTLIDVSVTDTTADGARRLTEAVVGQFQKLVAEIETTERGQAPAAVVSVVDPALTPQASSGPNSMRILAVGILAGLVLGCVAAFIRDRIDKTVRSSNEVPDLIQAPLLAEISADGFDSTRDFRTLRARIMGQPSAERTILLLTSFGETSNPDVTLKLSAALADTGRTVLIVDANTSSGGVSELWEPSNSGLAELLGTSDFAPYEPLLEYHAGVSVLPIGMADDSTPDLLASDRFTEIITDLESQFDFVIIDSAPIRHAPDALTLSSRCDATLAIVELGTKSTDLRVAAARFADGGARLMGAIVTSKHSRGVARPVSESSSEESSSEESSEFWSAPPADEAHTR